MLNELHDRQQESDESVWGTSISVSVETRTQDGSELVHKTYTFSYAKEWDKWTFQEYEEKRTPASDRVTNRNWRQSRHIMWSDVNDTPTIDVPPEVAEKVAEATGADEVVLQVPVGSVDELQYEEVYHAAE